MNTKKGTIRILKDGILWSAYAAGNGWGFDIAYEPTCEKCNDTGETALRIYCSCPAGLVLRDKEQGKQDVPKPKDFPCGTTLDVNPPPYKPTLEERVARLEEHTGINGNSTAKA